MQEAKKISGPGAMPLHYVLRVSCYRVGGCRLEESKSGRAKCKACREPIEEGTQRVGVETFSGGRFVVGWLHPMCFLTNTRADVAKDNRTKCKVTKTPITKGQLRFGWKVGMVLPEALRPESC